MSHLKRPSPALVISILALVAALVVPAYAALTKKDKKTVKNLANTEITKRAPGLAVASANSANTANSANSAGNAGTLDGQDASDFAAVGSEAWQSMTFIPTSASCHWGAFGAGRTQPAYFRDSSGVVHLKGAVVAIDGPTDFCGDDLTGDDKLITTLPTGYRPDEQWVFPTVSNNKPGRINIRADGGVLIEANFPAFADAEVWVSLDGISFRCQPSGSNGCP